MATHPDVSRHQHLTEATKRMIATIRRCFTPDPNEQPTGLLGNNLPKVWPYRAPFRALIDATDPFHEALVDMPPLRPIAAALVSVQALLQRSAQNDPLRLAFDEFLSETACKVSDCIMLEGRQQRLLIPIPPPESALESLMRVAGLLGAERKKPDLTEFQAAAKRLREEVLPDGKRRSFGKVARELNALGFTKRDGKPHPLIVVTTICGARHV
jgi:hypothetical protein